MSRFLIEFRLHGYVKDYTKELMYAVAKRFKVKGVTGKKAVPHITLYGPSTTNDIKRVASEIERIGRRYTLVPFTIKGFGYFNKQLGKTIYLNIAPSPEMEELRWELAQRLSKISVSLPKDLQPSFQFHATVAFRDIDIKFHKILSYIKKREEPNINQHLLRITILDSESKILYEYDLILRKMLNRRQALSKYWWQKTVTKYRQLQSTPEKMGQPYIIGWVKRILSKLIG